MSTESFFIKHFHNCCGVEDRIYWNVNPKLHKRGWSITGICSICKIEYTEVFEPIAIYREDDSGDEIPVHIYQY